MNIILFRSNPELSARVAQAKPDFVKEFPAGISIEGIAKMLPSVEQEAKTSLGVKGWSSEHYFVVDGTVLSAMELAESMVEDCWEAPFYAHYMNQCKLIRQDGVGAYDRYADQVAEAAKSPTKVVLVRANIADHNTEGVDESSYSRKSYEDPERIEAVIQKWITRLTVRGVTPVVVDRIYCYSEEFGERWIDPDLCSLEDAVVICDHHHGRLEGKGLQETGARAYFNAFPPAGDFCDW